MENRKKPWTTLQSCIHLLKVERHIASKSINVYTKKEVSENVNVTESVKSVI